MFTRQRTRSTVALFAAVSFLSPTLTAEGLTEPLVLKITHGENDGERHPAVVSVVFRKSPEHPWVSMCSGTLISPTVILSAWHCTADPEGVTPFRFRDDDSLFVPWTSADDCPHCPDCTDLCPNFGVVFDSEVTESSEVHFVTPVSHPAGSAGNGQNANDVGLLILDQPVTDIIPACLPEANFLENSDMNEHQFTNVGYGVVSATDKIPMITAGTRRVSTSRFIRLNAQELHLTNDTGGTCFGDSGGPQFFEDTPIVVSVTSGGDQNCNQFGRNQRVDNPSVREFLSEFLELDEACLVLPSPVFTRNRDETIVGEEVVFDAQASTTMQEHSLISYEWDFGDGHVAVGDRVAHTYDQPGRFPVQLKVTDDRGFWMATSSPINVLPESNSIPEWSAVAIGDVEFSGGTRFDPAACAPDASQATGHQTSAASGNITGRVDAFHFVHQEIAGDFRLTARVTDWTAQSTGPKLGLMLRTSLEPDASMVMVALDRRSTSWWYRSLIRETAGASLSSRSHERYPDPPVWPVWVRLERRGTTISGALSTDGADWLPSETVEFPSLSETTFAGVASSWAAPPNGGPAPLATVCDVEITPLASAPRFVRGDCDGDSGSCSGVNDALTLLSWLFLGRTEPPCLAACDPDGNGELELADAVYSLNFCFTGTEAPAAPFPGCADGTESDSVLGCANSTCEAATF